MRLIGPAIKPLLLTYAERRVDGKNPATDRRVSDAFTSLEIAYIGVKGEWVVGDVTGSHPDWQGYGLKGDNGIDLVVAGVPCQIKTSHRKYSYLTLEASMVDSLAAVERMVLVTGPCTDEFCCCRDVAQYADVTERWMLVGSISVKRFWRHAKRRNWGLGERYVVAQPYLSQEWWWL